MKIPMDQILQDEDVQRTICLIVQAELEEANKFVAEKVEQVRLLEEETSFLKGKIVELEKANKKKSAELRTLRRQLENEKARSIIADKKRLVPKKEQDQRSKPVKRKLNLNLSPPKHLSCTKPKKPSTTVRKETTRHTQNIWEDGWVCVCGLEFSAKKNLEMHLRYHRAGSKFTCTRCPTRFVHATDMRKHLRTVHNVQPDAWMNYGCRLCGSFFLKITQLLDHRKTHKFGKNYRAEGPSRSNGRVQSNQSKHGLNFVRNDAERFKVKNMISEIHHISRNCRRFVCHCGKDFSSVSVLERHVGTENITKDYN